MNDEGNVLTSESHKALRMVAVGLGILIYLAVLAFTAAHNLNLMLIGVAPDWQWSAYLGVLALELSAIALPLGLHYWAFAPLHRWALIFAYILDFALLFGNTVIDYAQVTGGALPAWGATYLIYFAPGAPLFALATWAILLALDPRQAQAMKLQAVREAVRLRLADQIAQAMGSQAVQAAIQEEAVRRARALTAQTLGEGRPAGPAEAPPSLPATNGKQPKQEANPTLPARRG